MAGARSTSVPDDSFSATLTLGFAVDDLDGISRPATAAEGQVGENLFGLTVFDDHGELLFWCALFGWADLDADLARRRRGGLDGRELEGGCVGAASAWQCGRRGRQCLGTPVARIAVGDLAGQAGHVAGAAAVVEVGVHR